MIMVLAFAALSRQYVTEAQATVWNWLETRPVSARESPPAAPPDAPLIHVGDAMAYRITLGPGWRPGAAAEGIDRAFNRDEEGSSIIQVVAGRGQDDLSNLPAQHLESIREVAPQARMERVETVAVRGVDWVDFSVRIGDEATGTIQRVRACAEPEGTFEMIGTIRSPSPEAEADVSNAFDSFVLPGRDAGDQAAGALYAGRGVAYRLALEDRWMPLATSADFSALAGEDATLDIFASPGFDDARGSVFGFYNNVIESLSGDRVHLLYDGAIRDSGLNWREFCMRYADREGETFEVRSRYRSHPDGSYVLRAIYHPEDDEAREAVDRAFGGFYPAAAGVTAMP